MVAESVCGNTTVTAPSTATEDTAPSTHQPVATFSAMNLPDALLNGLTEMGYTTPSPIQQSAIVPALLGRDVMCTSETGSGKTAAFLIPVCAKLLEEKKQQQIARRDGPIAPCDLRLAICGQPRAVILAPTRELASQIAKQATKLCAQQLDRIACVVVYGQVSKKRQTKQMVAARGKPLLLVATPGRLKDFVESGVVSLSHVKYVVLDEADRMLDNGFRRDTTALINGMMTQARGRQTLLFSATFPPAIRTVAEAYVRTDNTVRVTVGDVNATAKNVVQHFVESRPDKTSKLGHLVELLQSEAGRVRHKTLVFIQKKRDVKDFAKLLAAGGVAVEEVEEVAGRDGPHRRPSWPKWYKTGPSFSPVTDVCQLHGDVSQPAREKALAHFADGTCSVMLATDAAGRGLDIKGVTHVIIVDLPTTRLQFENYVHRIGRTGRAGATGKATSLYVPGFDSANCNGPIAKQLLHALSGPPSTSVPDYIREDAESTRTKNR